MIYLIYLLLNEMIETWVSVFYGLVVIGLGFEIRTQFHLSSQLNFRIGLNRMHHQKKRTCT